MKCLRDFMYLGKKCLKDTEFNCDASKEDIETLKKYKFIVASKKKKKKEDSNG